MLRVLIPEGVRISREHVEAIFRRCQVQGFEECATGASLLHSQHELIPRIVVSKPLIAMCFPIQAVDERSSGFFEWRCPRFSKDERETSLAAGRQDCSIRIVSLQPWAAFLGVFECALIQRQQ